MTRTRTGPETAPPQINSDVDRSDEADDGPSSLMGDIDVINGPDHLSMAAHQDGRGTTTSNAGRSIAALQDGRGTTAPMIIDVDGDCPHSNAMEKDLAMVKNQLEALTKMFMDLKPGRHGFGTSKSADSSSAPDDVIADDVSPSIPDDDVPFPDELEHSNANSKLQVTLPRRHATIDKFDPSSNLPARLWMSLFETEFDGTPPSHLTRYLAMYLTKDGLRWFAQFIAPLRKTYSWPKVKELFLEKFAKDDVNPLVAAKDRYLKSGETIQTYFDDKTQLLELAQIPGPGVIGLLTDGVPESYRSLLIARNPKTVSEWLACAQLFESTKRMDKKNVNVVQVPDPARKKTFVPNSDEPPKKPCPRCLEESDIHAYHWLRNCTLPRTNKPFPSSAPSNPLNSKGGPSRA